ncbi:MAG TPA: hypothetical protein VK702_12525 [Candidatus Acidoferrum sp.]|nr:hypothetical protein [Candidatus Acidoferrum sp.]
MKRGSIRFWFCIASAVLAAAMADPLVESLSNAGWFGPGSFTDHSNLDVLPVLLCGAAFVICYLALRVRRELLRASGEALRAHVGRLLPYIVAAQLTVLYAMETVEQVVVAGHVMGGTVWLGGPIWFSLGVHALVGTAVAYGLARLACACAQTTLRVLRRFRALATRALHAPAPLAVRGRGTAWLRANSLVRCRIGNRAPPLTFA